MQKNKPNLLKIVAYYDPLLQRYARRLIGDTSAAAIIVQKVLEEQYDINSLAPGKHLRQTLKAGVFNCCFYWKQSKVAHRPTVKVLSAKTRL